MSACVCACVPAFVYARVRVRVLATYNKIKCVRLCCVLLSVRACESVRFV